VHKQVWLQMKAADNIYENGLKYAANNRPR